MHHVAILYYCSFSVMYFAHIPLATVSRELLTSPGDVKRHLNRHIPRKELIFLGIEFLPRRNEFSLKELSSSV